MGSVKAQTHLQKLGFSEKDKKNLKHDTIQKWAYDNIDEIVSKTVMADNPHPYKIVANKWEHQVLYENGNYKMIVGYIDLMVIIKGQFYFHDTKKYEEGEMSLFIEVKTQIPSLGELIRQMRAYQSYQRGVLNRYMVIAPDDTHKDLLKEQGFLFYKYQDPTQLF